MFRTQTATVAHKGMQTNLDGERRRPAARWRRLEYAQAYLAVGVDVRMEERLSGVGRHLATHGTHEQRSAAVRSLARALACAPKLRLWRLCRVLVRGLVC